MKSFAVLSAVLAVATVSLAANPADLEGNYVEISEARKGLSDFVYGAGESGKEAKEVDRERDG